MSDCESYSRSRQRHRKDGSPRSRSKDRGDHSERSRKRDFVDRDRSRSRDRDYRRRSRSPPYKSRRSSEPEKRRTHRRRDSLSDGGDHRQPKRSPRRSYEQGNEGHSRRRSRERERNRDRDQNPHDSRQQGYQSKSHRSQRDRSSSRSPARKRRRSPSPPPRFQRSHAPLPSQQDAFNKDNAIAPPAEKQKPNYNTSGKLAAETNTVAGTDIVLKYNEPPEARKPSSAHQWRMYEFKGSNPEPLSTTDLYTRSCWLFGRERAVVDFAIEHPSCSKQHAVIQFRFVEKKNEFGDRVGGVKPYVIDLESANGTKVNGERIPEKRFFEVKNGDMVAFGESTREYVLMLPPKE